MDTNNSFRPQGSAPQPNTPQRPAQPIGQRPTIDGFAPRRPLTPPGVNPVIPQPHAQLHHTAQLQSQPTQHHPLRATTSVPANGTPQHQQAFPRQPAQHAAVAAVQPVTQSDFLASTRPAAQMPAHRAPSVATTDMQLTSPTRPPREKDRTGHAGIVGFVVFVLFTALLLSPFLPGKIIENFPFASNTFSTGDSTISCLSNLTNVRSTTHYKSKVGSPITYTYSTSTTQTASCDGQSQSAVTGHTSQFNPLGLVVDVVMAIVVAIGISWIWRLIFGEKKHKPRDRKE